jgi:hypothetical protein
VDFVSMEAESLADSVVRYLEEGRLATCMLAVKTDANVTHAIPQKISGGEDFKLSLRVRRPVKNAFIRLSQNGNIILEKKMPKAIPAEMIQIPVKARKLNKESDLEVSVVW